MGRISIVSDASLMLTLSLTLLLVIVIPKIDSLAIAMLAKGMAYPTNSLVKSLVKICLFPHGPAIAKDFAKASVNGNLCITNVLMVNIC